MSTPSLNIDQESLTTVWLGLGGNVGDVCQAMKMSVFLIDSHHHIQVEQVSSLYRTPPWGEVDQPDFLNACLRLKTALEPLELLAELKAIEKKLKREKTRRNGPRTIDLDILVFGDVKLDVEGLQIPHPRMLQRAFVLVPLAEISPKLFIADQSVDYWRKKLDDLDQIKIEHGPSWAKS